LATTEERVQNIYRDYIERISRYIVRYEVLANKFPLEILNEIRAVLTHLSKYYLSDDPEIKAKNVSKTEGHIQRAILDCYKYLCMVYEDKLNEFKKDYENVDLSLVADGKFLPELLEMHDAATTLIVDARESDLVINSDDETSVTEAYEKYEKAFVKYSDIYTLITESYTKVETLKRKVVLKKTRESRIGIIGIIVGIAGIIIGIVTGIMF